MKVLLLALSSDIFNLFCAVALDFCMIQKALNESLKTFTLFSLFSSLPYCFS